MGKNSQRTYWRDPFNERPQVRLHFQQSSGRSDVFDFQTAETDRSLTGAAHAKKGHIDPVFCQMAEKAYTLTAFAGEFNAVELNHFPAQSDAADPDPIAGVCLRGCHKKPDRIF
jgi:hypothetical protein